jgi:hypothetical protein
MVNRDLPITVHYKTRPDFLINTNHFTITYVDSKGAKKMWGENNTVK